MSKMSNNLLKDPATGRWLEGRYETQAIRGIEHLRELISLFFYFIVAMCCIAIATVVLTELLGMKKDNTLNQTLLIGVFVTTCYYVICAICV